MNIRTIMHKVVAPIVEPDNAVCIKVLGRVGFGLLEARQIRSSGETAAKPFCYYRLVPEQSKEVKSTTHGTLYNVHRLACKKRRGNI